MKTVPICHLWIDEKERGFRRTLKLDRVMSAKGIQGRFPPEKGQAPAKLVRECTVVGSIDGFDRFHGTLKRRPLWASPEQT